MLGKSSSSTPGREEEELFREGWKEGGSEGGGRSRRGREGIMEGLKPKRKMEEGSKS